MGDIDEVASSTAEAVRASEELLEMLNFVRDDVARALDQSRSEIARSRALLRGLHREQPGSKSADE